MFKFVLWICAIVVLFTIINTGGGSVSLGPGVKAPDEPLQTLIPSAVSFYHRGSELTPLADYSLKAKVLSKKKYKSGPGSGVCPVDFALGWGNMSDEEVLEKIEIRQSGRFFYWSTKDFPIERQEIIKSCANVHLIPATDMVESVLNEVKAGQIIYLGGKLVKVKSPDGWNAVSSLTRTDSGGGACEVLYVENAFRSGI